MAWEARLGLKPLRHRLMCSLLDLGLNGLGSPFGIETLTNDTPLTPTLQRLNGLGSPFGIETARCTTVALVGEEEEASPPGSSTMKAVTRGVLADLRPPAQGRQWSRSRLSQGGGYRCDCASCDALARLLWAHARPRDEPSNGPVGPQSGTRNVWPAKQTMLGFLAQRTAGLAWGR